MAKQEQPVSPLKAARTIVWLYWQASTSPNAATTRKLNKAIKAEGLEPTAVRHALAAQGIEAMKEDQVKQHIVAMS